jgi:hypothetical protein
MEFYEEVKSTDFREIWNSVLNAMQDSGHCKNKYSYPPILHFGLKGQCHEMIVEIRPQSARIGQN